MSDTNRKQLGQTFRGSADQLNPQIPRQFGLVRKREDERFSGSRVEKA